MPWLGWQSKRANDLLSNKKALRAGDIGMILQPADWHNMGGQLLLTGRAKDVLVLAGGDNVAPAPIEDVLARSSLISQVRPMLMPTALAPCSQRPPLARARRGDDWALVAAPGRTAHSIFGASASRGRSTVDRTSGWGWQLLFRACG